MTRRVYLLLIATLLMTAAAAVPGGQVVLDLISLSVSKEIAPPGGMAQVKVFITEPKPISTVGGSYLFEAYDSIEGIAIMNDLEDVVGIALVRGSQVTLSCTSPSGTFGLNSDYPVLTVAGRVPATAPVGTRYRMAFDLGTLQFFAPTGAPYTVESKTGHIAVGSPSTLSVWDVNPGSALVPAGGVVTLTGSNFSPRTEVRIKEAKSRMVYVDPTRIDLILSTPLRMHGEAIRVANPDGARVTYFSYQRTYRHGNTEDPVLRYAVPLMPPSTATVASVALPAPQDGHTYGIAVQNIDATPVHVLLDLLDESGASVAATSLVLPASRFIVRDIAELFGVVPAQAWTVRVSSDRAIQAMGMIANQMTGAASPILAQ